MRVATFASVAALALISTVAQAQVSIWEGPGKLPGTENVLFNDPSLMQTGNNVQGYTNRNHFVVDFFSDTSLDARGGQAQINTEAKGGVFTDLSLSMDDPGMSITNLVFSLDAVADGSITFNITSSGGVYTQTFDLDK